MLNTTKKLIMPALCAGALTACAADPSDTGDGVLDDGNESAAEGIPGEDPNQGSDDKAVNRMYIEWCVLPGKPYRRAICKPYNFNSVDWDNDFEECKRDVLRVCGWTKFFLVNYLGTFESWP